MSCNEFEMSLIKKYTSFIDKNYYSSNSKEYSKMIDIVLQENNRSISNKS